MLIRHKMNLLKPTNPLNFQKQSSLTQRKLKCQMSKQINQKIQMLKPISKNRIQHTN